MLGWRIGAKEQRHRGDFHGIAGVGPASSCARRSRRERARDSHPGRHVDDEAGGTGTNLVRRPLGIARPVVTSDSDDLLQQKRNASDCKQAWVGLASAGASNPRTRYSPPLQTATRHPQRGRSYEPAERRVFASAALQGGIALSAGQAIARAWTLNGLQS